MFFKLATTFELKRFWRLFFSWREHINVVVKQIKVILFAEASAFTAGCGGLAITVFQHMFDNLSPPILTTYKFPCMDRSAASHYLQKLLTERKIVSASTCCHNVTLRPWIFNIWAFEALPIICLRPVALES